MKGSKEGKKKVGEKEKKRNTTEMVIVPSIERFRL